MLRAFAAELRDRVRARRISDAVTWDDVPEDLRDEELRKSARQFSHDWGDACIRSLAGYYADLRVAHARSVRLDPVIEKVRPLITLMAAEPLVAWRADRDALHQALHVLAPLVEQEDDARRRARREALRNRSRVARGQGEQAAIDARLDSAFGRLPPIGKEWACHFAFEAFDCGLGPTHAAKLEALIGHGYFPGVPATVTATLYLPKKGPASANGGPRTSVSRWSGCYSRIGLRAPPPPIVEFSSTDGAPILRSNRDRA